VFNPAFLQNDNGLVASVVVVGAARYIHGHYSIVNINIPFCFVLDSLLNAYVWRRINIKLPT